ncbi:pro-sigmaK processing inhibitor BofA family protein [Guptibacillus algicola]|uniref:pro-sigmaK processing inhibitor BofA family protein n=1 Tax=Guptibacillus algicola TaxID=225844 RepID=UPI001CD2DAE5|nr:pro-sigmaK processing inhibitor BofA family protein [Alkalihalobacillus algicola]MCA0989652.1 pro-sigmaK processing inhibitor BofA family protein [Alkalihalobacillus algicola]
MDPKLVIGLFAICIVLLLFIGAPLKPMRWIGHGLIKLAIGALLLFFLNTFGTPFDLHVPINFGTAAISGFLGLPGLVALACIQLIIIA